jgi:hypothetical protein
LPEVHISVARVFTTALIYVATCGVARFYCNICFSVGNVKNYVLLTCNAYIKTTTTLICVGMPISDPRNLGIYLLFSCQLVIPKKWVVIVFIHT